MDSDEKLIRIRADNSAGADGGPRRPRPSTASAPALLSDDNATAESAVAMPIMTEYLPSHCRIGGRMARLKCAHRIAAISGSSSPAVTTLWLFTVAANEPALPKVISARALASATFWNSSDGSPAP